MLVRIWNITTTIYFTDVYIQYWDLMTSVKYAIRSQWTTADVSKFLLMHYDSSVYSFFGYISFIHGEAFYML